jgi:RNA polymerase primary sigma factor
LDVQEGTDASGEAQLAPATNGHSEGSNLTEIIKALLKVAREHGQLTYDDINDILPDGVSAEQLDVIHTRLHELGVEITEHAEAEKPKAEEPEPEEERSLDSLDDPVRMYLNQMGKVPLLTREQEVEVCKRIEGAEMEMKRLVYELGFAAKEHMALAQKLLSEPPKERFDRVVVDAKIPSREAHLKELRRLLKKVQVLDAEADGYYLEWRKTASADRRKKLFGEYQRTDQKLQKFLPKFAYKQKAIEDMIVMAGNVHVKFKAVLTQVQELKGQGKSARQRDCLRVE